MVPHHGTNWAALRLTAQIGRDAVLSESYGRGYWYCLCGSKCRSAPPPPPHNQTGSGAAEACPKVEGEQKKKGVQPFEGSNKSLEQGLNLSGS